MRITVVHPSELGARELGRWREMQRATPTLANPFLAPEFTVAVGRLQPRARVAVLWQGPEIRGLFPFERRGLGHGVPIAAGLTDAQGLVHDPGLEWDPRQLLRACGLTLWEFDHLVAGQVPFAPFESFRAPSPVMDLTGGYDAYLAGLGPRAHSLVKDVQRKQRRLERDAGEVEFVLDSRDLGALRALMAWKSAQYQRTGRADRFAQRWIVTLVEQLLDTRGHGFSCVLALLRSGGRPVAAHVLLRLDDVLAGWFPAYDPQFYRCSPGTITRLRTAEAAAADGVTRIEMGRGAKPYKELFKSRDDVVAEGRVTRPTPVAAVHWVRRAPVRRLRQVVLDSPRLYPVADRLLRSYGRARSALRHGQQEPGAPSSGPHPPLVPTADRSC
jgi:CelD/BcsL family acetyltransferase involved in cellulose biosynthesis